MEKCPYPEAREWFITADTGGSNGYRSRAWKHGLQKIADETGERIHISDFPPAPAACAVSSPRGDSPQATYRPDMITPAPVECFNLDREIGGRLVWHTQTRKADHE